MYKDKKIIAIITARGGSKGLPGKNIKPLLNKPLIGWTIEQAKNCEYIDEIFVSTDCPQIKEVSEQFGAKIPVLRPEELASDTSSSMDVVEHVINYFEDQNQFFDYIILLEPTSPLRGRHDLSKAIEQLINTPDADGITSIGEVHTEHPMIVEKLNANNRLCSYIDNVEEITQRQQADEAYFPYGVVYAIKTKVFKEKRAFHTENIIPYFIERWQCYEIDDIYDFYCIEAILEKQRGAL
jgi:CMP-N,N'-diacetyllegionaminic acid synthase